MNIHENAKDEVLHQEGNSYFERNLKNGKIDVSIGCQLFGDFLNDAAESITDKKVLEVGYCYGYNLMWLCEKYGLGGYGIEPSKEAVSYGKKILADENNTRITLKQGTADTLPFSDEYFDIVLMGFCVFWVDRKYLLRAVAEADRVLKTGGLLVTWDFDTKIPYRRKNIHNDHVPTYKYDLAKLYCENPQYSLIEKRSFSHNGKGFHKDIQERCALNILYKEEVEKAYIFQD